MIRGTFRYRKLKSTRQKWVRRIGGIGLVLILALAGVMAGGSPTALAPVAITEPTVYLFDNHYYEIEQIAYAVAVREGSIKITGQALQFAQNGNVCGIKSGRPYRSYGSLGGGLVDCQSKLGNLLYRTQSVSRGLTIWKNGDKKLTPEEKAATQKSDDISVDDIKF